MTVPFFEFFQSEEQITKALARVESVVRSGSFIGGHVITELEHKLANYLGVSPEQVVTTSSGTDSLVLALLCLGVGPEDYVIVPPFTFYATIEAILLVGAKPLFVDIWIDYNINSNLVAKALSSPEGASVKAIMPVHLFGQMCNMGHIQSLAANYKVHVIEDAAQSIGSYLKEYNGDKQYAGTIGDVGCFSLFPTKNLGCMGDGGFVVARNPAVAYEIRHRRAHCMTQKYCHDGVGGNYRLDALQAAFLIDRLEELPTLIEQRRANAAYYKEGLADVKSVSCPFDGHDYYSYRTFNQYCIQFGTAQQRTRAAQAFKLAGIGFNIYYPVPCHLQPVINGRRGAFPMAEAASERIMALPIYPGLKTSQQDQVIDLLKQLDSRNAGEL